MTVRCDQCRAVLRKHDPRVTVAVHATVTIARPATHALDQATTTVTPFNVSRVYCTNCYVDAPLTFTVQARAPAERPLCDVTMWCARCAKTTYHLALGKQLQCNECRELQTPPEVSP